MRMYFQYFKEYLNKLFYEGFSTKFLKFLFKRNIFLMSYVKKK